MEEKLYLLIGDEFLQEEFIENLKRKFIPPEADSLDVDVLRGDETSASLIMRKVNIAPMLSSRRLVIVKGVDRLSSQEQSRLGSMLSSLPDFTLLVLTVDKETSLKRDLMEAIKRIEKEEGKEVVRRFHFSVLEREKWIIEEMRKRGKKITGRASNILANHFSDIQQLKIELEKLSSFVEGEVITEEDVMMVSSLPWEETVFKFAEALFQKRKVHALKILHRLLEMEDFTFPQRLIGLLSHQVRLLMQLKFLQEKGLSYHKGMKIPPEIEEMLPEGEDNILVYTSKYPWVMNRLGRFVNLFSFQGLAGILRLLFETDLQIKEGAPAQEKLELLVVRICEML